MHVQWFRKDDTFAFWGCKYHGTILVLLPLIIFSFDKKYLIERPYIRYIVRQKLYCVTTLCYKNIGDLRLYFTNYFVPIQHISTLYYFCLYSLLTKWVTTKPYNGRLKEKGGMVLITRLFNLQSGRDEERRGKRRDKVDYSPYHACKGVWATFWQVRGEVFMREILCKTKNVFGFFFFEVFGCS